MSLYISNPSRQEAVFYYRRAKSPPGWTDNSGPGHVTIPAGGQVMVGAGWTRDETAYVIEQIMQQGGEDAAVAHGRMGKFTGLLYREFSPVQVDEIETAHESVKAAAEERSVTQATRGAMAFDRVINKGRRGQREARTTEVEIKQELPPHVRPTGDEVHMRVAVDPDGSADVRGIPGLA